MISSILSAVREEFNARIIGIPPPTLASNRKLSSLSRAMDKSSAPCFATSALLDVTTLLPASRHLFTNVYGRLNASHYFHYNADLRIVNNNVYVMYYLFLNRIAGEISEIKNIFYIDLVPRTLIDNVTICIYYLDYAGNLRYRTP